VLKALLYKNDEGKGEMICLEKVLNIWGKDFILIFNQLNLEF